MLKYVTSAIKATAGGFSAIITTPQVDTDGESVSPAGMVNLAEYLANPLVYWAHEWAYNPSAEPIGKAVRLEVHGDRIEAEAEFAPTAKAQNVRALVQGGFVRQTSIGFDPLKMEMVKGIPTHTQWALREFSVVPMAANTGAVMTGVKSALSWLAGQMPDERKDDVSDLSLGQSALSILGRLIAAESLEGETSPELAHAIADLTAWMATEDEPSDFEDVEAVADGALDQLPTFLARKRIATFRRTA